MDKEKDWDRKFWAASVLLALTTGLLILALLTQCGDRIKKKTVYTDESPCGEAKVGDTKSDQCTGDQDGEIISLCNDTGWNEIANTCSDAPGPPPDTCNKVTFEEYLKPIIEDACLGCHLSPQAYNVYEVARIEIDEWIRRINLSSEDPRRMPKYPEGEISPEAKEIFNEWRADGLIRNEAECESDGEQSTLNLDYIENQMIADISRIDQSDRKFIRYLVTAQKVNLREPDSSMGHFESGINKAFNALVRGSDDLTLATPIDKARSVYRIDLRSFELDRLDWLFIERDEPFNIVSLTDKGRILQFFTATRKPWIHFDNAMDTILGNADLYYQFVDVPETLDELFDQLGVDLAGDIANFDAIFAGTADSPISNQKNRLVVRFDGNDGYVWITFDPEDLDGVDERNLFEFPLIEIGQAQFQFFASEVIWELRNGLHGYALFNAAGIRQDFAPIDIVRDVESPIDPQIDNAVDCFRCHGNGLIPMQDEIRSHVLANASEFNADDLEFIKQLYQSNAALTANFNLDNRRYQAAKAGIKQVGIKDPVNFSRDKLRLNWDISEVAAFLFLDVDDFKVLLNQSPTGRAQIGQLLSGGTITFDQFVNILPVLIEDLKLFEEPINGE